jgi:beta-lactamase class A
MTQQHFSRREFLKLASLGVFSLAARPALVKRTRVLACPQPPLGQDVLTAAQRTRLREAARGFLAADDATADQVALRIDFIEGRNEDASTMCGPLSIAMLQAAALVGPWARKHDFWLLNPRQNPRPLEYTFPTDQYSWLQFDTPISQFDFSTFPLLAGDLVYLHAGSGDTFEHVLVVNRIDESGRAFSVTNFFTYAGTIIEERMLNDPAQPNAGQFQTWADRNIRNTLGNTGSGGFRIWRVKDGRSLEFPSDTASQQLRASLDELLLAAAGTWYAAVKKVGGAKLYQFNPYEPFHPASTIKVPIALAFYHWLENQNLADWQKYIAENGTQRRTYAQLLEAMIVESEEDATQALVDFLGEDYLQKIWKLWGLKYTQADPRRSSASEIVLAFEKLYGGGWITPASRAHLLKLMSTYTSNDDSRLGTLRRQLPAGSVIYNKRGSLVDWPRVVGDSAIIQIGDAAAKNAYVISMHGLGKDDAGYDDLEVTLSQAVMAVGKFLKQTA